MLLLLQIDFENAAAFSGYNEWPIAGESLGRGGREHFVDLSEEYAGLWGDATGGQMAQWC